MDLNLSGECVSIMKTWIQWVVFRYESPMFSQTGSPFLAFSKCLEIDIHEKKHLNLYCDIQRNRVGLSLYKAWLLLCSADWILGDDSAHFPGEGRDVDSQIVSLNGRLKLQTAFDFEVINYLLWFPCFEYSDGTILGKQATQVRRLAQILLYYVRNHIPLTSKRVKNIRRKFLDGEYNILRMTGWHDYANIETSYLSEKQWKFFNQCYVFTDDFPGPISDSSSGDDLWTVLGVHLDVLWMLDVLPGGLFESRIKIAGYPPCGELLFLNEYYRFFCEKEKGKKWGGIL